MHYVTEDWELGNQLISSSSMSRHLTECCDFIEEVLIDFREIVGEHSGRNLADAVWETIECYGLKGKVRWKVMTHTQGNLNIENQIQAIVADNASNNDTMMMALEERFTKEGIPFSAQDARLRCCPHTIHLSAMEVTHW
jgi:hypothetical protein